MFNKKRKPAFVGILCVVPASHGRSSIESTRGMEGKGDPSLCACPTRRGLSARCFNALVLSFYPCSESKRHLHRSLAVKSVFLWRCLKGAYKNVCFRRQVPLIEDEDGIKAHKAVPCAHRSRSGVSGSKDLAALGLVGLVMHH